MLLGAIKKNESKKLKMNSKNKVYTYKSCLLRMQHAHCLSHVIVIAQCSNANIEWRDRFLAHANCTPLLEEKDLKNDRLKKHFFGHLQHT